MIAQSAVSSVDDVAANAKAMERMMARRCDTMLEILDVLESRFKKGFIDTVENGG